MKLKPKTKIGEVLKEYPFLVEFLPTLSPVYNKLKNPILRKTLVITASLDMIAEMGDIEINSLISKVENEIQKKEHSKTTDLRGKKEHLKEIIRDLHKGIGMDILKQRFAELIKDVSPSEISDMEQSLIDEGMPESEVKRLCDVHVEVFKQSLEKQKRPQSEPGHPIHTFMLENRETEKILKEIENILEKVGEPPSNKHYKKYKKELVETVNKLGEINKHYLRKENQLFPILEKHNVTGPTQVMWEIHDDIRTNIKNFKKFLSQDKLSDIITTSKEVHKLVKDMIYKEEYILYPMSLETLNHEEWINVRNGESEIGYAWIKPAKGWSAKQIETKQIQKISKDNLGKLSLDTGKLTLDQLNLMLTHLPVDLSFVDENDQVAYYSNTPERIFPRSPAVIGRKVQKCHPPKSVHIVKKILKEFKTGKKNVGEFWIQLGGKFIHIRYFAVRDSEGKYKGTLEVSQEITDIKKLEGERRLLDWS